MGRILQIYIESRDYNRLDFFPYGYKTEGRSAFIPIESLGGIQSIPIERMKTNEFVAIMSHGWRKNMVFQVDKVYDRVEKALKSY